MMLDGLVGLEETADCTPRPSDAPGRKKPEPVLENVLFDVSYMYDTPLSFTRSLSLILLY